MKKVKAIDQVLEIINSNPGCDTKTITEQVDYGQDTVRKACAKLVAEGKISKQEIKLTGALKKFLFTGENSREKIIEKAKKAAKISSDIRNAKKPKNRSRVAFKGEELGKAKLVKTIVMSFVNDNKNLTYAELAEKMNYAASGRRVYPKYDVIRPLTDENVQKSLTGKSKRYYVNVKDVLKSADGIEFVICREWGMDNIDKDFIIPIAQEKLNFTVETFSK